MTLLNNLRLMCSAVCTEELITDCIKAVDRVVDGIDCIVIAALTVFCLVIDCGAVNLNFTCA